ncbi:hypothetical protein MRX96_036901 [Rhipicephalus microplus]
MMVLASCVFALVLLVASPTGAHRTELKDGCTMDDLKKCGDDYIPYSKGGLLRMPNLQFAEGCKLIVEQINCSLDFMKSCTQQAPQAAALVVLQALKENIEDVCAVGSKAYKKFQKSVKCMELVGQRMHRCMQRFHDLIERAVMKAPVRDVIPHGCCIYNDLVGCWSTTLAPCERVQGKEFALGILDDIFGEVVHLVCGRYIKTTDACKELPPLPQLGKGDQRLGTYIELVMEVAATYGRKN